jgi:hypothetical protein
MWYYCIHESRANEVQDMVRQDAAMAKEKEAANVAAVEAEKEAQRAAESEQLDAAIQMLQNALVSNVTRIAEFDPDFAKSLPYVSESGSVDVAWHWQDRPAKPVAGELAS